MNELKIVDVQQSELIIEILRHFNFLINFQNEKENLIIIPESFISNPKTIKNLVNFFALLRKNLE